MRQIALLLATLFALVLALPAAADGPIVYVVQSGDTLTGIAQRYQTSADAIARLNNLFDQDSLQAGQKLTITQVSEGETGSADNGAAVVGPRREAQMQPVHVVAPGETLSQIAEAYDTTVAELMRINKLSSAELINAGQRLFLPNQDEELSGPAALVSGKVVTYIVRKGDTLEGIAFRYGLDARSLLAVNDLPAGSTLWIGQRLSLPLGWRVKDAPTPALRKRIEVDVSDQHVYAYEGEHLVLSFVGSTGLPTHPTRRGRFTIQTKMPLAVSTGLNLDMPYWLGIYYAGGTENGFHALPINRTTKVKLWSGLIGRPVSYGCIVLRDGEMKILYDWAELGTVVDIHD